MRYYGWYSNKMRDRWGKQADEEVQTEGTAVEVIDVSDLSAEFVCRTECRGGDCFEVLRAVIHQALTRADMLDSNPVRVAKGDGEANSNPNSTTRASAQFQAEGP